MKLKELAAILTGAKPVNFYLGLIKGNPLAMSLWRTWLYTWRIATIFSLVLLALVLLISLGMGDEGITSSGALFGTIITALFLLFYAQNQIFFFWGVPYAILIQHHKNLQPWQRLSLLIHVFCFGIWLTLIVYGLIGNISRVYTGAGLHPLFVFCFWSFLIVYIPLFLISVSLYPIRNMIFATWCFILMCLPVILISGVEEMY